MIRVCAVLLFIDAYSWAEPRACERSTSPAPKEGNVGETNLFPWLGVLRVHIHQGEVFKVALTGLVLVKVGYAIANADDVARIPKWIFKEDSKAMFIASSGAPWFCNLLDYMTHPEYEYATTNTIALLELDPGEETYPMRPICWPPYSFNTSNELYAIGFTDDNQLLEKSIFSIKYVERSMCEEFYNRVGLTENNLTPAHFICGFAKNNKENCVWDNGMVLASNSTKFWTLVGFGVRGPGCAAPARFIDLQAYFTWIESATNFDGVDDMVNYRKSAFNEGFKKSQRKGESTEEGEQPDLKSMIQNYYPFNTEHAQNMYFTIDRIDDNAINIRNISLPGEEGNCSAKANHLIYKDSITVTVEGQGSVSYKISMYDLFAVNYSCVKLQITPSSCNDTATLYYTAAIDNMEGSSLKEIGTTPEKLFQLYPILTVTPEPEGTDPTVWKPGPHLKASFLEDERPAINIENFNIYLKFTFENEAKINLEVLGPMKPVMMKIKKKNNRTSTTPKTLREGDVPGTILSDVTEKYNEGITEALSTPSAPLMLKAPLPVEAPLLVEAPLPVEAPLLVEAPLPVEAPLLVEAPAPLAPGLTRSAFLSSSASSEKHGGYFTATHFLAIFIYGFIKKRFFT